MRVGEIWELVQQIAFVEIQGEEDVQFTAASLPNRVKITELGLEGTIIAQEKTIQMDLVCFESLDDEDEDEDEEVAMKISALPQEVFVKTYRKVYDYETAD
jgi:hypothetical protein